MFKLIPRENVSPVFSMLGPLFSIGFTMLIGGILFYFLGVDPFAAIKMIFWDPLMSETFSTYSIPQIFIKGAPLILIALGLSKTTNAQGVITAVPCDMLGMVMNVGSQETSISIYHSCLLYTSPSPRDLSTSRMPSSA